MNSNNLECGPVEKKINCFPGRFYLRSCNESWKNLTSNARPIDNECETRVVLRAPNTKIELHYLLKNVSSTLRALPKPVFISYRLSGAWSVVISGAGKYWSIKAPTVWEDVSHIGQEWYQENRTLAEEQHGATCLLTMEVFRTLLKMSKKKWGYVKICENTQRDMK